MKTTFSGSIAVCHSQCLMLHYGITEIILLQQLLSYNVKYLMNPKRGRPRKLKSEVRKPALSVRLTKAELKAVEQAAKKQGVGLSVWATKLLLEAAEFSETLPSS